MSAEKQDDEVPAVDGEAICKQLGSSVVGAVRASNNLPSSSDYAFYSTFAAFKKRVANKKKTGQLESRILSVVSKLVSHVEGGGGRQEEAGLPGEPEDLLERVVDFAEARLEKVDNVIDELTGKAPNAEEIALRAQAGKFKQTSKIKTRPEDLGIPKPQQKFEDVVDNSNTPFSAKSWPKVHGRGDHVLSSGRHPYEEEIDGIEYQPYHFLPQGEVAKPRDMAETPFSWVATEKELVDMHKTLSGCKEFAVDLEHHSLRSFQGFTCLMQISTREQDFIVDTIELRSCIHLLLPAFTDPKITKVFHGADSDVRWLQRDFGLYIVNMFDTGQASRVLEFPSYGLAYLLHRFCEEEADKQYQLADWRVRPLTPEMLKYARMDTHYLLYIYDQLRLLLRERAAGSDQLVKSVLSRSNDVCKLQYEKEIFDPSAYLHVLKRSGRLLNPRQSAVFAKLFEWRDQVARAHDESTDFVLPTSLLFKISTTLPDNRSSLLESCRPHVPPLLRELHAEVLDRMQSALQDVKDVRNQQEASRTIRMEAIKDVYMDVEDSEEDEQQAEGEDLLLLHPDNLQGGKPMIAQGCLHHFHKSLVLQRSEKQRLSDLNKVSKIRSSINQIPRIVYENASNKEKEEEEAEDTAMAEEEQEEEKKASAALEEDGMPHSIKETFKGKGGKRKRNEEGEEQEGKGGREEGGEMSREKKLEEEAIKLAESLKKDKKVEEEEEKFEPFDYSQVKESVQAEAGWKEKLKEKSEKKGKKKAEFFDPHNDMLGQKESQVRANRRARPAGKSATFAGNSQGGKGGGKSQWPQK